MSEAPKTRTGPLKTALVEGVQADLDDLARRLDAESHYVAELEEVTRGVNGLQARCRGWRNSLAEMVRAIEEERDEVAEKLLGKGPEIQQSVDMDLGEKIARAKRAADPDTIPLDGQRRKGGA